MTNDAARAERISAAVDVGNVCINDFGMTYMAPDLPFGGVKASGFGRLNGRAGLRACCNTKAVLSDRFPVRQATALFPVEPWDYATTRATIRTVYGQGVRGKLRGLLELGRAALSRIRS